MKKVVGFTLIELVIVITIIGILSAVAFTLYVNIQSQARTAKASAIYGTIRTAANLAKSVCVLDISGVSAVPTCTPTGGTANMSDVLVDMVNQYPAATLSGIIAATQINPSADQVTVTVGNPLFIDINGGIVPNCRVSYTEALPGAMPVISLDVTNC